MSYTLIESHICDNVQATEFDGLPLWSLGLSVSLQNSQT